MAGTPNTFKNIAVPGQKTVIAESPSDTLTIVPGPGLKITTDVTTDTLRLELDPTAPIEPDPYVKSADVTSVGFSLIRVVDEPALKKFLKKVLETPDPVVPSPIEPSPVEPAPIDPPPVVTPDPPVVDPVTRTPLTGTDVTLAGHAALPNLTYANHNLTFRYVKFPDGSTERRILVYHFGPTSYGRVGDIVEYRLGGPLKPADSHWPSHERVPPMQEVRRWKAPSWHTRQRMLTMYPVGTQVNAGNIIGDAGNGAWPASFFFDERSGLLWYTWQPVYPGGAIVWPAYSAVRLTDAESTENGGTGIVSDANVYGPYFFKDGSPDDFKSAAAGILPIPADQQASLGGKFLIVGHHSANIGSTGARGSSFWVVKDLPVNPPAPGSNLFPDAVHIYDTGSHLAESNPPVFPYSMKIPNVAQQVIGHASQGTYFYRSVSGAPVISARSGEPVGIGVNDTLQQHDYGDIDVVAVTMSTPAAGGTFVPEIALAGGTWQVPTGWKMAAGKADLSERENVFYWPTVSVPGQAVRLRRTQAGTSGGTIEAIVTSSGIGAGGVHWGDRPDGQGGLDPVETFKYDATHFAYTYENFPWGEAFVSTDTRTGIVGFMPISTGGQWYGAAPMWARPRGAPADTPPRKYRFALEHPSYSNGGKTEGPRHPFAYTFDPQHVAEAEAGTRPRNGSGLQPSAFFDMVRQWPGLVVPGRVPYGDDPHYGAPTFNPYGAGNSVAFDPVAKEILVLMTNGTVWQANTILAVYKVR